MEASILLKSFFVIFLAELGDKSQFLMVALTARYRIRDILCGAALAVCVLNLLAVTLGSALGQYLPTWVVSVGSAIAFFFFARSSFLAEDDDEKAHTDRKRHAVTAVFCTYFLAELGDKTQLSVLALSAEEGTAPVRILPVLVGASAGLFLAGVLGLFVGTVLGRRLPQALLACASAVLFFSCGIVRLLDGLEIVFAATAHPTLYALIPTVALSTLLVIWCANDRKKKKERKYYGKVDTSADQSVSEQ